MIDFTSIHQMLEDSRQADLPLWKNIQLSDCHRQDITPEVSWTKMAAVSDGPAHRPGGGRHAGGHDPGG